ncbi:MAG TPA: esterase-like activity of phytase family protein, partial [Marivita sp.]|nr:esterase-like activity of phytase family protein [Marivita sp.]
MTHHSQMAQFLSSYTWSKDREDFGGYSGIVISPDGGQFTILSDRAHVIEGILFRHGDRILGVRSQRTATLDFPETLFEESRKRDSEGLAKDVDGRLYVSLESSNQVARRDLDGTWSALPPFPAIQNLSVNKGLEALAVDADGTVYAIPEASDGLTIPFPVFAHCDGKGWSVPFALARTPGVVPVGADFGPDGLLYVLERGFAGFGFYSQVRRFALEGDAPLEGEMLLRTAMRRHDNLEGIAVWQNEGGDLRLTMISDDNFNRFQKTEIV